VRIGILLWEELENVTLTAEKEDVTMLQAVEGIYRNGVIELLEIPHNIQESRVLITFLSSATHSEPTIMTFGMFSGEPQSTEADFAIAQFQGDRDDGLDW
jgi:hypothetical protein